MCHIIKKKKAKSLPRVPDSSTPSPVPLTSTVALSPNRSPVQRKWSKSKTPPKMTDSKAKGRGAHRKCNKRKTVEERKKEIEDAQKALGRKPNSTIVDRMVQMEKVREKSWEETRKGDIQFVLKGAPKEKIEVTEKKSEEFTIYPEKAILFELQKSVSAESSGDEDFVEDVREPMDTENWMYHDAHIFRTCHNNIRELEKGAHACYVHPSPSAEIISHWDRFATLETMEARELFTSTILEVYTFISATETMDDVDKAKAAKRRPKSFNGSRPTFDEEVRNLENLSPSEITLAFAVSDASKSLNTTPASVTIRPSSSRSGVKTARTVIHSGSTTKTATSKPVSKSKKSFTRVKDMFLRKGSKEQVY